jgi:hypothetical protein
MCVGASFQLPRTGVKNASDSERGLSPVTGNGDIEGHGAMKAEFQRAACQRTPGSTALSEGWLWYLDGWSTGS